MILKETNYGLVSSTVFFIQNSNEAFGKCHLNIAHTETESWDIFPLLFYIKDVN